MKKNKLIALFMAMAMTLTLLAGCGKKAEEPVTTPPAEGTPPVEEPAGPQEGPIYDEWSDKTDAELYELAKAEGGVINVYANSSKMQKEKEPFEADYPGLVLECFDLDQDEVLGKAKIEAETNNITADVLEAKDVNGTVFYDFSENNVMVLFYPRDICAKIDPSALRYGYPLYTSQTFWYYNTKAFPDGQPINNWWQIIEKKDDGNQKYRLFTKEIGQESAYLSLFASFIGNADQMEKAYKDCYGKDLEYTYDASVFDFEVPANNAGVEYMWRFSQMKMTFIGDGDELVLAVDNSTKDDPALCLTSGGKITNRDESGYSIAWCTNLAPYTGLQNYENMYVVNNCDNPAGARLFIRYITGGVDGTSEGMKPFSKEGNWPVRSDVVSDWNPVALKDTGAIASDLKAIYDVYLDTQDMWTFWLGKNPNM